MVRCTYECTLWSTFFFIQFINGLTERYPEVFDEGGSSSPIQANFGKKWGAYQTLITLCGNNLMEIDNVVKQPLEKCLLYISFQSDRNQLENLISQEAMKKI